MRNIREVVFFGVLSIGRFCSEFVSGFIREDFSLWIRLVSGGGMAGLSVECFRNKSSNDIVFSV